MCFSEGDLFLSFLDPLTYLSAAWQMVPHVSAMSSTRIATRSFTSPTRTIRSTSFAFFLSLWIKANSTFSLSAIDVTLWKDAKEHGHTAHLRIYYWALGWGNSWIVNSLPWKNKNPSSIPRTHACDPSFWEAETCRSLGLVGLFCELQAGSHWETLL